MADLHVHETPEVHHETSDVDIRAVLGFGLALVIAAIFIHFGVWLLFYYLSAEHAQRAAPEYPLAVGQENRLPPEPRLQVNPREDLRALRAQEDAILTSYGWVDRNAGIARIPIDEAMKVTVRRGLPARQESHGTR